MKVSREPHPDLPSVMHVHPVGRIDAYGADPFFEATAPLITDEHPSLLIDLAGVDHLSSAGVAVVVRLLSRTRQKNGRIAMYGASTRVATVIRIIFMESALNLCDGEEEAFARLCAGEGEEDSRF
jgi:anti-anti-sigma factor